MKRKNIVALDLQQTETRVVIGEETEHSILVSNYFTVEPILDYVQFEKVDKLASFFRTIEKEIGSNIRLLIGLPDTIIQLNLIESPLLNKEDWEPGYMSILQSAFPAYNSDPNAYLLSYPAMITPHLDKGKCYVSSMLVPRKFVQTLIMGVKHTKLPIPTIEPSAVACARFAENNNPCFFLTVEQDRYALTTFLPIGIDGIYQQTGRTEILQSAEMRKKFCDRLFLEQSKISEITHKEGPFPLIHMTPNEEIAEVMEFLGFTKLQAVPHYVVGDFQRSELDRYAATIGLLMHDETKRRLNSEAVTLDGFDSEGSIPGGELLQDPGENNFLAKCMHNLFGNRPSI